MAMISEQKAIRIMRLFRRVAMKIHLPSYHIQCLMSLALPSDVTVSSEPLSLKDGRSDTDLSSVFALVPVEKKFGNSICENDLSHSGDYDLEIIIPAYNVEKYIGKCLDSVIAQQTKYKFLTVVVNDGSTDDTSRILHNYEQCPNLDVINKVNGGLSSARNSALKHIRAHYVTFLDSDDWLLPGAIEKMMDAAVKYSADIVEGCFKLFDGSKFLPCYSHEFDVSECWHGQLQGYSCGKVIKSGLFAESRFPEGYLFEDTLMSLTIFPKCRNIVTIPDDVYVYRVNPKGITATIGNSNRAIETLLVTLQLMEDNAIRGLKPDIQSYNNFLKNEIPNTFSIISSLNNPLVNHHVFSVFCRMINQFFAGFNTNDKELRHLEHALVTHDFRKYVASIMSLRR